MRPITVLACLATATTLVAGPLAAQSSPLRPGDVDASHLEPFEAHYSQAVEGQTTGQRIHHLQRATFPDGPGFRYVISMLGADTVYDEIRFLAAGFEPVSRHVSARTLAQNVEVWQGTEVRGVRMQGSGAKPEPFERRTEGARFAGALELILTALEPEEGPSALAAFNTDFGLDSAEITLEVKELRREKLRLADRDWNARLIESRILGGDGQPLLPMAARLWVTPEAPYLVRMEMGPMVVELTALR